MGGMVQMEERFKEWLFMVQIHLLGLLYVVTKEFKKGSIILIYIEPGLNEATKKLGRKEKGGKGRFDLF